MRTYLFFLTIFLLAFFVSTIHAVTVYVPDDFLTIQAAIDACVDGDSVIVRDGTYTGDGNRDIDFMGKAIVLMSENGPEVTIIDCENYGRGFYFHSGEESTSVLQGFTIMNGYVVGDGGGMYNDGGSPTVTNCTFIGNTATWAGGGMNNNGGSPMVSNCTFSGNSTVNYDGGGMRNNGSSPTVTNCTFIGNTANRSGGGMRNGGRSGELCD